MTAIELLEKTFNDPHKNRPFITKEEFEVAKQLEKQQILAAFSEGASYGHWGVSDSYKEEYYEETYKKPTCEYSGLRAVEAYSENEYPEVEGTLALCNEKIWGELYEEYSREQYPPFGGPFTDSSSFIDWLKQNYKAPKRI